MAPRDDRRGRAAVARRARGRVRRGGHTLERLPRAVTEIGRQCIRPSTRVTMNVSIKANITPSNLT